MKMLHRPDLFSWATFNGERNVDFNSVFWARPGGNVMIDPLPLSEHDQKHVESLGGVAIIVITNSDHTRDVAVLAPKYGAKVYGPAAEREGFAYACDRWLRGGDEVVPGLVVLELEGSKTPGELALVLEEKTLITGDLVRAHRAGSLMMLPKEKLKDQAKAIESVRKLAALEKIEAVLVGDGWPVFRDGRARLKELV